MQWQFGQRGERAPLNPNAPYPGTGTEGQDSGAVKTTLTCAIPAGMPPNPRFSATATDVAANATSEFSFVKATATANLTIVKNTQPAGSAQSFAFTCSGASCSPTVNFNLTGQPAPANTRVFIGVAAGTYIVGEAAITRWTATAPVCVDAATGNAAVSAVANGTNYNVNVTSGMELTCTFVNALQPMVRIVKNTVGGSGTFNFAVSVNSVVSATSITTTANTGTQSLAALLVGQTLDSIVESAQPGWTLTSTSCNNARTGAAVTLPVTLAARDNITCTFTNTQTIAVSGLLKSANSTTLIPGQSGTYTLTPSLSAAGGTVTGSQRNCLASTAVNVSCTYIGAFPIAAGNVIGGAITIPFVVAPSAIGTLINTATLAIPGANGAVTASAPAAITVNLPAAPVPTLSQWAWMLMLLPVVAIADISLPRRRIV